MVNLIKHLLGSLRSGGDSGPQDLAAGNVLAATRPPLDMVREDEVCSGIVFRIEPQLHEIGSVAGIFSASRQVHVGIEHCPQTPLGENLLGVAEVLSRFGGIRCFMSERPTEVKNYARLPIAMGRSRDRVYHSALLGYCLAVGLVPLAPWIWLELVVSC